MCQRIEGFFLCWTPMERHIFLCQLIKISLVSSGLVLYAARLSKLVIGDLILNVISAYAPQVGLDENVKRQFWEDLDGMVRTVPTSEKLFIRGDLNGHVGTSNGGYELAHGGFGYGSRNQEGEEILDFAVAYDLMIANTFFRKRESHLVTFSSGHHTSQIDFVLTRREDKRACLDCKVIPASTWIEEENANNMWVKMATCIRKVASEVFGVTKGKRSEPKDTWWWNEEVQKAIK
ncbi:hypothetical protein BS78_04G131400, partial [Paspalum vaginatum]